MTTTATRFANDDDAAHHWLALLRDGDDHQKIIAREQLAVIFERRGMVDEALELLETNARLGVQTPTLYGSLARLYRVDGNEDAAADADGEASQSAPYWRRNAPPVRRELLDQTTSDPPKEVQFGTQDITRVTGIALWIRLVAFMSIYILWFVGLEIFLDSGMLDQHPDTMNPLISLWYILFLVSLVPSGILIFQLTMPAIVSLLIDLFIIRCIVGPRSRTAHDWIVLALVLILGLIVQFGTFSIGQAVLDIPAHTRLVLPRVVWAIYWVVILPYAVNTTVGLASHLLISTSLGVWLGVFLYRVATK